MRISDWSSDVCSSDLAQSKRYWEDSLRKIGLIGGMSWASTEIYNRQLNKGVQKRIGTSCSAPILLESLNYCELSRLTTPEQWDNSRAVLTESAKGIQDGGAAALITRAHSGNTLAVLHGE